ncbi:type II toxin-antitoxin system RelE/ParE family toxin [Rhodobacteraceae bacterium 2376]|uniref:Type II toxin-antitoxin system RelE/ParE family toxin n=1 Tax=Rhabdonatronobacter sediminivivens TaxID=2743469 RepID=A0A7Z0I2L7_9RHOB|nr:type II toxin-antitoxin system RelE/ParE family toxin [Rhabdonatronobacter sediminivivens]NYS26384.1 type II toxin-antitoxin system RelE/ParE family toxin [Rhabdonatronobacter sediminivivens]
MRIFLEKQFSRWAADKAIGDETLIETAEEAFNGNVDADLGGYLFKMRLAREGKGKSGGYRTIICFRKSDSDRIFFLHGFPKNSKGNITAKEEKALKLVAKSMLKLSDDQIAELEKAGAIRALRRAGQ